MPILVDRRDHAATVQAVREVRVDVPRERVDELRDFYLRVLGLPECPHRAQIPGGWRAGPARRGVYFVFSHDVRAEPMRRRLTIEAPDLDDLAERLAEEERPFRDERGWSRGERRILVVDPVGHLVEVRQCRPL
jgi:hypothetical protein